MLLHLCSNSPIGNITVFRNEHGISRVDLSANPTIDSETSTEDSLLRSCLEQMDEYFSGQRIVFDLPLNWSQLSGFSADVLHITHQIPFGSLRTYGEIAVELGKPNAARAVGGALARNPLPILIPCHRVIAASGHLTGFSTANGIASKAWLLQLERHRVVDQKLA